MLETLEDKHFTDWYGKKTKPETAGPYQCLYPNGKGDIVVVYSTWTGTYWTPVKYALEDLKSSKRRAKMQAIKWRGLTEEGHAQLTAKIEAERSEKLRQENSSLLEQLRLVEKKIEDALANAEVRYSAFLIQCKRDSHMAARAKICLQTSDLESLRPSEHGDAGKVYVENPHASLEEANSSLKAGLSNANGRLRYWSAGWLDVMELGKIIDPSTDVVVRESNYRTPAGMTVSYGAEMKSKIAKAAPPWAFHGSFGSKSK